MCLLPRRCRQRWLTLDGSVGRLLTEQRTERSSSRVSTSSNTDLDLTKGVGTPLYMSLEMLNHAAYDASRVELWRAAMGDGRAGADAHGGASAAGSSSFWRTAAD